MNALRPAPDLQAPAELRREIQRAGAITGLIRAVLLFGRLAGLAIFGAGSVLLLSVATLSPTLYHTALPTSRLITPLFLGLAAGCWVASRVATPVAAAYRRLRREQLRHKLARLPREHLAEVLLPLRDYRYADTRRIVQPLIRDLRPEGTEVAPAGTPPGSGSEPAPPAVPADR
jgi:hypothetical protein